MHIKKRICDEERQVIRQTQHDTSLNLLTLHKNTRDKIKEHIHEFMYKFIIISRFQDVFYSNKKCKSSRVRRQVALGLASNAEALEM